ncbi:signal peptidase I [Gammaproteobacteria bacterium 45_16_T64]|nr:signal peptidase I [Gammaproteobacteria bacterium 45_16_T64]
MDFSLILVVLVSITGVFVALDLMFFQRQRVASVQQYKSEVSEDSVDNTVVDRLLLEPWWIEYPKAFFPVLALVLVLRSFLIEPFKIPSGSMIPTLKVGDYILVNKFAYGFRLPVIGTEIIPVDLPKRGDVMVFKYPENPRINYIKRVVGVPGDTIRYENKLLYINGEEMPKEFLYQAKTMYQEKIYNEDLGTISHEMQVFRFGEYEPSRTWTIGDGEYFAMGDNRDNSRDSRSWGIVPESNIVGKAFAVWMHMPGWVPSFDSARLIK